LNQSKRVTNGNKKIECAQPSIDKNFYADKCNHKMTMNKKGDVKNLTEFNKKYEKYFQR